MQSSPQTQLAKNLAQLAKSYQSSAPEEATAIKLALKAQSKNDTIRTIVYLLEVVGARDAEFKKLQEENKDLRELLKVNNIALDEENNEGVSTGLQASEAAAGSVGSGSGDGTKQSGILPEGSPNKFGNEAADVPAQAD